MRDILHAARATFRRPALPVLVILLFGLGTGVATSLWAVIDAAFLRPLPYPQGDRLMTVLEKHSERGVMAVTPASFLDWSERVREFQGAAAAFTTDASVSTANGPGVVVPAMGVTGTFFSVLGQAPAIGRVITPVDVAQRARVVVLSYRQWRTHLHGMADLTGASVRIDGEPFDVIGVMPDAFRLFDHAELWTPLRMTPDEWRERRFHMLTCIARLEPGATPEAAERTLAAIYGGLEQQYPETNRGWRATVVSLRDSLTEGAVQSLVILAIAVAIVIVIACVNVASILAVYLPMRRSEFLIRIAVGATVGRIVRQILVETLFWASAGLAVGMLCSTFLLQLFGRMVLPTTWQFDFNPRLDLRVTAVMVVFLILVVLATAVIPAVMTVRRSTDLIPKRAGRGPRLVVRSAAVVQVAMAVLLLTLTAALLLGYRGLATAGRTRHGAETIAVRVALPENRYADGPSIARLFERLLFRVTTRHEVRLGGGASYVPPEPPRGNVRFTIEGRATESEALTALPSAVTASAFSLLEISLLRGRLIEDRDTAESPHVAVISDALARRYWPGEDPVGRRIQMVGIEAPYTIVGIVENVRQPLSVESRAEAVLYLPYRQNPWPYLTLIVSPSGAASAAVAAVREELQALDPALALGAVHSLDEVRTAWLEQPRLQATTITVFGGATLFLTLVGLYVRVAHGVAVRQREFAIRQAIGASPADLIRGLTLETTRVMVGGGALALVCLPAAQQILRSSVQGVAQLNYTLGPAVALALTVVGTCCAYFPARRAARATLATALKAD